MATRFSAPVNPHNISSLGHSSLQKVWPDLTLKGKPEFPRDLEDEEDEKEKKRKVVVDIDYLQLNGLCICFSPWMRRAWGSIHCIAARLLLRRSWATSWHLLGGLA